MEISMIEKKLFDKEVASFKEELKKGSLIIQNAFEKYYTKKHSLVGFQGQFSKELNAALTTIICANEDYSAGHVTNVKDRIQHMAIPNFLQERMLDVATARFFEQINEIKEVTDNLDI